MKATGIVRRIDDLGRVVIPKEIRRTLHIKESDPLEIFTDKDGAVIEVEIENTLIRGTVQLTKIDKDYPDNKLTGAVFAVYRDSNGNKELDADDELLGTLTETGTGVYEMPDLIYGGYFVKETKAPEGFYLDENAYYFEITENGKTVTVDLQHDRGTAQFTRFWQKMIDEGLVDTRHTMWSDG